MYYFIVNAASRTGKAKKIWNQMEEYLKEKQIDYMAFQSKYAGHAKELAKEISNFSEPVLKLIVFGGDGTVNEVLNGIVNFDKIRLGYIPTGSGNDFGRGLSLPKDPLAALNRILSATEDYVMDIGQVTYGRRRRTRRTSHGRTKAADRKGTGDPAPQLTRAESGSDRTYCILYGSAGRADVGTGGAAKPGPEHDRRGRRHPGRE